MSLIEGNSLRNSIGVTSLNSVNKRVTSKERDVIGFTKRGSHQWKLESTEFWCDEVH